MRNPQRPAAVVLAAGLALATALLAGGSAQAEPADFKLTLGRYASSDGHTGLDTNLRASTGAHTGWLGFYSDRSGGAEARTGARQTRSGYEFRHGSDDHGDALRSVWSLQSASGGVAVAAVTAEVGGATYALLGLGRTNVRPYVNLNFDPNDAITMGIGSRAWPGREWLLFNVHDDRLHTRQNVSHAVWRERLDAQQRLTLDLSVKSGALADGSSVRRVGSLAIGYDRGPLFLRFSHDPQAGFGSATQNRLQAGARF